MDGIIHASDMSDDVVRRKSLYWLYIEVLVGVRGLSEKVCPSDHVFCDELQHTVNVVYCQISLSGIWVHGRPDICTEIDHLYQQEQAN